MTLPRIPLGSSPPPGSLVGLGGEPLPFPSRYLTPRRNIFIDEIFNKCWGVAIPPPQTPPPLATQFTPSPQVKILNTPLIHTCSALSMLVVG